MSNFFCESHLLPPSRFRPSLDVAGICCEFDGKILLIQRAPTASQPGTWGFAAGKVEKGEDLATAACRELFEETGISVTKEKITYLIKMYCRQPQIDYIFHGYACLLDEQPQVRLNPDEHSVYEWLTVEEALQKDLMGGGLCALQQYQRLRGRLQRHRIDFSTGC